MSSASEALVREWFQSVWNQGSEEAIDRLMHPDAAVHGLSGPRGAPIRGPEAFKPFFRMFRRAMSDLQIDVVRTLAQGDMVAAHCRVFGRHSGDALGAPASQQPVEFWGMTFIRVQDGRIIEGWNCFDFLSMYQQVGWVTNPPLPAG